MAEALGRPQEPLLDLHRVEAVVRIASISANLKRLQQCLVPNLVHERRLGRPQVQKRETLAGLAEREALCPGEKARKCVERDRSIVRMIATSLVMSRTLPLLRSDQVIPRTGGPYLTLSDGGQTGRGRVSKAAGRCPLAATVL